MHIVIQLCFGLKTAGATYRHAFQNCLRNEIGDELVEAYVDDLVVETRVANTLINGDGGPDLPSSSR